MVAPPAVAALPSRGYDPRVRAFRCGVIVDSFAVLTERYLVLIDTMINPRSMEAVMSLLQDELPSASPRQLLVVNTHGDWDHVWGNAVFAGPEARYPAPILAHRLAAERMSSSQALQYLARMQVEQPDVYGDVSVATPTILFDQGLRIDGGDLTLELVPTPGHTPDHVAVWIPQIRLLLAGDAAELPFPYVTEHETIPTLRASLAGMEALDPATVLYCHAPGIAEPWLIRHNVAYFEQLEARCREARRRGAGQELEGEPWAVIDWPLSGTLPQGMNVAELSSPGFYAEGHDRAIRAMMRWVAEHPGPPA